MSIGDHSDLRHGLAVTSDDVIIHEFIKMILYPMRLISNANVSSGTYESPSMSVIDINSEGVLCSSFTEDNEYIDGEW